MQEVTGTVTRTNHTGFVLDGGQWFNLSKFANVAMPQTGQRVAVKLDKAGFVRAVQPIAGTAPDAINRESGRAAAPNTLEARIAALQTATVIVARQSGPTSIEAVITAAERLEGWLTR